MANNSTVNLISYTDSTPISTAKSTMQKSYMDNSSQFSSVLENANKTYSQTQDTNTEKTTNNRNNNEVNKKDTDTKKDLNNTENTTDSSKAQNSNEKVQDTANQSTSNKETNPDEQVNEKEENNSQKQSSDNSDDNQNSENTEAQEDNTNVEYTDESKEQTPMETISNEQMKEISERFEETIKEVSDIQNVVQKNAETVSTESTQATAETQNAANAEETNQPDEQVVENFEQTIDKIINANQTAKTDEPQTEIPNSETSPTVSTTTTTTTTSNTIDTSIIGLTQLNILASQVIQNNTTVNTETTNTNTPQNNINNQSVTNTNTQNLNQIANNQINAGIQTQQNIQNATEQIPSEQIMQDTEVQTPVISVETEAMAASISKSSDDVAQNTKDVLNKTNLTQDAIDKLNAKIVNVQNSNSSNANTNTNSNNLPGKQDTQEQIVKLALESNNTKTSQSNIDLTNLADTSSHMNFEKTLDNIRPQVQAQAPQQSSGNLTQTDIMAQINKQINFKNFGNEGTTKINIILQPENLGKINLELISSKEGVTAQMTTSSQQVKEMLDKNIDSLKETLGNHGVNVNNVSVKVEETQKQANENYLFDGQQPNSGGQGSSNNSQQNQNNPHLNEDIESTLNTETETENEESVLTMYTSTGQVDYKI